jgi:hypothetical protein
MTDAKRLLPIPDDDGEGGKTDWDVAGRREKQMKQKKEKKKRKQHA